MHSFQSDSINQVWKHKVYQYLTDFYVKMFQIMNSISFFSCAIWSICRSSNDTWQLNFISWFNVSRVLTNSWTINIRIAVYLLSSCITNSCKISCDVRNTLYISCITCTIFYNIIPVLYCHWIAIRFYTVSIILKIKIFLQQVNFIWFHHHFQLCTIHTHLLHHRKMPNTKKILLIL